MTCITKETLLRVPLQGCWHPKSDMHDWQAVFQEGGVNRKQRIGYAGREDKHWAGEPQSEVGLQRLEQTMVKKVQLESSTVE